MALIVKDRVQETSSTTGTGTLTLSGAVSGYQTFSSAIGNGNTTYYSITDGTNWEVGLGTVSAGTLSRDTVLSSSTGTAISFGAGVKTVFVTYPAGKSVTKSADLTSGRITYATTDGILADSANLTFNGTTLTASALTSTGVSTFSAGTAGAPAITTTGDTNTGIFFPAADTIAFSEGGTESMRIDSSGNVGIGTASPVAPLSVVGNILSPTFNTNTTYTIGIQDAQTNSFVNTKRGNLQIQASSAIAGANGMGGGDLTLKAGNNYSASPGTEGNVNITAGYNLFNNAIGTGAVIFTTRNAERMRLDSSGNLGLGITPSAWASNVKAIEIGAAANTYLAFNSTAISGSYLYWNMYYNGTNNIYKYTGFANAYGVDNAGKHLWFTAPSGTAGATATLTQAMTLDASGRLGVGTASPAYNLTIGGGTGSQSQALIGGSAGASTLRLDLSGTGTFTAGFNNSGATVNNLPTGVAGMWMQQAYPVIFGTNATERMRIDSAGNVGIGTTTSTLNTLNINGSSANYFSPSSFPNIRGYSLHGGNASGYTFVAQGASESNNGSAAFNWQTSAASVNSSTDGALTTRMTLTAGGNLSVTGTVSGTNITTGGNTTGNAATATNLIGDGASWVSNGRNSAVVGQLGWKNYGNGHTIIDASASTSPTGSAINNTNSAVAWSATYPTLMGWNGVQTYGVRVDTARLSDLASACAMSSGRTDPTAYPVVWGVTGASSQLYSCTAVNIQSSTGTLSATTFSGAGTGLTGTAASLTVGTATALSTASGSAPSYSARAWVNFNGTGTVAIRASGNVSSITDNGTGNYTVNFTTAMPSADYATTVNTQGASTGSIVGEWGLYTQATNAFNTPTTAAFRLTTWNSAVSGLADTAYVMASVFI